MSTSSEMDTERLPSGGSSNRRKTDSGAVSLSRPSSCQAMRVSIALLCPKREAIAAAAGLRSDTLFQYLNGRREAPPPVRRVLAGLLREQSENLLIAAAGLEDS
jgi:hypothetical protein